MTMGEKKAVELKVMDCASPDTKEYALLVGGEVVAGPIWSGTDHSHALGRLLRILLGPVEGGFTH